MAPGRVVLSPKNDSGAAAERDEGGDDERQAVRVGDLGRAGRRREARNNRHDRQREQARGAGIALFTPDATLTWFGSADDITVAVSGATKVTRPSPNTSAPGSTSRAHVVSGPMRVRSSNPIVARIGPTVSWRRGPMRCASAAGRRGTDQHEHGHRQQRGARLQRRPSRRDLQFVRNKEERDTERGIEQPGREVHHSEVAVAEQRGRHERVFRVQYPPDERRGGRNRHCTGDEHQRVGPPAWPSFGQRQRARRERERRAPRPLAGTPCSFVSMPPRHRAMMQPHPPTSSRLASTAPIPCSVATRCSAARPQMASLLP